MASTLNALLSSARRALAASPAHTLWTALTAADPDVLTLQSVCNRLAAQKTSLDLQGAAAVEALDLLAGGSPVERPHSADDLEAGASLADDIERGAQLAAAIDLAARRWQAPSPARALAVLLPAVRTLLGLGAGGEGPARRFLWAHELEGLLERASDELVAWGRAGGGGELAAALAEHGELVAQVAALVDPIDLRSCDRIRRQTARVLAG